MSEPWSTSQTGRPSTAGAGTSGAAGGSVFKRVGAETGGGGDAVFRRGKGPETFTMREGGESDTDSHTSLQAPKRKRVVRPAWEGGSQVDEERFLAAMSENTRLKQELFLKEERTKKLLTQLARAEEAAKRAIVKEGEIKGAVGGGGRQNRVAGANAHKLFEQEKVIVELRDKLRATSAARDREHERALHFKAMSREFKLRLESMAAENRKLQRVDRSRPLSAVNGSSSRGGGGDVAALQDEVHRLRDENRALSRRGGDQRDSRELRSLQAKVRDYEAQLASMGGAHGSSRSAAPPSVSASQERHPAPEPALSRSPSRLRRASFGGPGSDDWVLEEVRHEGHVYLLDRKTGRVYSNARENEWPVAVGRFKDGKVSLFGAPRDFFASLDTYLRAHQARLKEVFDEFDRDRNGSLDRREMAKLCKALMPDVVAADVAHFSAMLDADGDGVITYEELMGAIKECLAAGKAAREDRSVSGGSDVLAVIRQKMRESGKSALELFQKFDADRNGYLDNRELAQMLQALVPGVAHRELRYLLAELRVMDVDSDGRVSYQELRQALRVGKLRREAPGAGASSSSSGAASAARPSSMMRAVSFSETHREWVLEEFRHEGRVYLRDPKTGKVYENARDNQWPRAVGYMDGSRVVIPSAPRDFFASLDTYLRAHQARLKEVFDEFDRDRNGSLDRREMAKLCKALMPDVVAADVAHFSAMLDADGDGVITYEELMGAIKECLAAGRATVEKRSVQDTFLAKVAAYLRDNTKSARQLFREVDADHNGWLSQAELAKLVRKVVPGVTSAEVRMLLAELRAMDVAGDGRVSFHDFYAAVRAGTMRRVAEEPPQAAPSSSSSSAAAAPRASSSSSAPAPPPSADWVLEEIRYDGSVYLLDPKTGKVYANAREDQWPLPVGKMVGGQVKLAGARVEFFVALDEYLKKSGTRLRELFDEFDRDGSGYLDQRQLARMFHRLVPGVTNGQVGYAMSMLDGNGDGRLTFAELMQAIKDCVGMGQSVRSDRGVGGSGDVLGSVREYMRANHISARDLFAEFDANRNGYLEAQELVKMLRRMMPDVSSKEVRFLLAELNAVDVDGDGRISYAELRQALRIDRPTRRAPGVPASPSSSHSAHHHGGHRSVPNYNDRSGGADGASRQRVVELEREVDDLRAQAAEIPVLHRDLADARAAMGEMQAALAVGEGASLRRSAGGGGGGGSLASSHDGELGSELKKAWERVGVLQQRYVEVQEALTHVKSSHERVIKQLDDTHKRLNEERKANLKLEADGRRLGMELEAAREVQPLLEQARSEQMRLEKENHQLLAKAMAAPQSALAEMRTMRTAVAEQQRERAAAELREAELRREMAGRGGGAHLGGEDAHVLRVERDTLRSQLARVRLDLEEAQEKLKVYSVMGYAPTPSDPGTPGKPWGDRRSGEGHGHHGGAGAGGGGGGYSASANLDAGKSDDEIRLELGELREQYAVTVDELRKAQKLLRLEEAQTEDLKQEVEEALERARLVEGELRRKLDSCERDLDRKQDKVHKLEAQLNRALYGGSRMRASQGGRGEALEGDDDDDDAASLAGLPEGENLFELQVAGASLEGAALGEDPTTFLTFDFYEHETQATPVVTGLSPQYAFTVQYEVKVDPFFLEYLDTKELRVELNRAQGVDFTTLGHALLPLRTLLRDHETGQASGRRAVVHYADILSVGGKTLGRLRYSLRMRRSISSALREYRQLSRLEDKAGKGAAGDPLEVAAAAADPLSSTGVQVVVTHCTGLRRRAGDASKAVPYASYRFPGFKEHDTPFGEGEAPKFDDLKLFPLHRSPALEQRLRRQTLDVHVFDDADLEIAEAGLIGTARIPLEALAEGQPVRGKYPLYDRREEVRGHVHVDLVWYQPEDPAARPPASPGPRAPRPRPPAPPSPRRRSDESDRSELLPAEEGGGRGGLRREGEELAPRQGRLLRGGGRGGGVGDSTTSSGYRRSHDSQASTLHGGEGRLTVPSRASLHSDSHSRSHSRYSERDSMEGWGKGSEVGRSVDAVRRSSAALPPGLPPLEDHVILSVNAVTLGSEAFNDPNIRRVFVLFEFLPQFSADEDQCTPALAKTEYELRYAFTRAFAVGAADLEDRKRRYKVGQMMRAANPDDASIPICLVSEEGDELREFAFAEANLLDLMESGGDWVGREIDLRDDRGNVVARLNLTLLAYTALRSIMRDTGPS